LSDTYKNLTGKSTGWQDFQATITSHFPPGRQYRLKTDNPFPL